MDCLKLAAANAQGLEEETTFRIQIQMLEMKRLELIEASCSPAPAPGSGGKARGAKGMAKAARKSK